MWPHDNMINKETKGALISLAVAGAIGYYFYSKLAKAGYWSNTEIEEEQKFDIHEKIDNIVDVDVAEVVEKTISNDCAPEIKKDNKLEQKKEDDKRESEFEKDQKSKRGGKDIGGLFDKKFADLLATVDRGSVNSDEDIDAKNAKKMEEAEGDVSFDDLMDFEDSNEQNVEQLVVDDSKDNEEDKLAEEVVADNVESEIIEEKPKKVEVKKSAIQLHLEEIGIGEDDYDDDEFEAINFKGDSEESQAVKVVIPLQNVNKKDGVAQIELKSILELYALM